MYNKSSLHHTKSGYLFKHFKLAIILDSKQRNFRFFIHGFRNKISLRFKYLSEAFGCQLLQRLRGPNYNNQTLHEKMWVYKEQKVL